MAVPLAERIPGHAERPGNRLGSEPCCPNVLIVEDGAEQIAWLEDHRPGIFRNLPHMDIPAMAVVHPYRVDGISMVLNVFDADTALEWLIPFALGYPQAIYTGRGNRGSGFRCAEMACFVEDEAAKGEPMP
ncbi:hypothetical protein [Sphingomonas sp.]|uniref:hypothetical protein n=1 Tax=Sphingomonas sp. TaxID=28214 RepID=UPI0028A0F785|nr:hypothetical protein [Sphingomonas sp.]